MVSTLIEVNTPRFSFQLAPGSRRYASGIVRSEPLFVLPFLLSALDGIGAILAEGGHLLGFDQLVVGDLGLSVLICSRRLPLDGIGADEDVDVLIV